MFCDRKSTQVSTSLASHLRRLLELFVDAIDVLLPLENRVLAVFLGSTVLARRRRDLFDVIGRHKARVAICRHYLPPLDVRLLHQNEYLNVDVFSLHFLYASTWPFFTLTPLPS